MVNPQAPKILRYEGIEKNGFIDGWIDSLENTAVTFHWGETYKRWAINDHLGPKPREHLLTFNASEIRTYGQSRKHYLNSLENAALKRWCATRFPTFVKKQMSRANTSLIDCCATTDEAGHRPPPLRETKKS